MFRYIVAYLFPRCNAKYKTGGKKAAKTKVRLDESRHCGYNTPIKTLPRLSGGPGRRFFAKQVMK